MNSDESPNPLLALPENQKEDLFVWLREGSDDDAFNLRLKDIEIPPVSRRQIDEFFKNYAYERWNKRINRAAQEADALVNLVRESPSQFSEAILAALGQEAFRQIAGGRVQADDLVKYTSLFLRAKEQDRSERALNIQSEKLHLARRNATEKALDAFARELPQNPMASAAFEELKKQLLDQTEHLEDLT
ncbi:MAG: DUF3486 family protein [Methylacidiphilales bacterium]|nr:DUF3486 family protein [Candidatus Methylacidiphilales bacterium]